MSLDCLNETIRFGNTTLQSGEASKSFIDWFIGTCMMLMSLVGNGWLLAVSWGNAYIDGIFKYPVCYLAFCDVLVAFSRLAQTTLHQFADASTNLYYCAVPYALMMGAINTMFLALILTPLQRCLFFVDVPCLSDHARLPRSIMMFSAMLFILSVVPPVGSILAPSDRCLDTRFCAQLPVNGLLRLVTRLTFMLSYVAAMVTVLLFVWKVREMKALVAGADVAHSSAEVNINRDILAMAVVQTINPIVLTSPTMTIGLGRIVGLTFNPWVVLMAAGEAQLNPLMDALSTIYYIKPYRRLALKTAKQIRQIISKTNDVNPTTTVVVNVTSAERAQPGKNCGVTFKTPSITNNTNRAPSADRELDLMLHRGQRL